MEKDYLDNIEEFDEENLPKIELDREAIKNLREEIFNIVKKLKKTHEEMDFNITDEKVIRIQETLGRKGDKSIFGVKNARLIRSLLIEEIKEIEGFKEEEIIASYFTELPDAAWWWKGSVCYQMYVTRDKFIVYGFDAWYNISTKRNINLSEVKHAGWDLGESLYAQGKCVIIQFRDGTLFVLQNYDGGEHDDLNLFIERLRESGVSDIDRSKTNWKKIGSYILIMIILLILISVIIRAI